MIAVRERNDRVGCFLDTFDMIGIEVKFAFVEPGKLYHDIRLHRINIFFILPFGYWRENFSGASVECGLIPPALQKGLRC